MYLFILFSTLWSWMFGGLAIALLISGLDDLIPLAICVWRRTRDGSKKNAPEPLRIELEQRRIAIFVPCWKESAVIGNMVRHNLAAIRYRNFDFFLGAYPNDEATVRVVKQLENFGNVHAAICPHPGPTSKADCLNWIYRRMEKMERQAHVRFDTIVLHDAEDLIHAEALPLINRERCHYDMVQVPVLPLPTPLMEPTHGVYCDEFCEFQILDMHARQYSKSFVPSNGVGTGFAREILEQLIEERGQAFDAESLTEDYEIGVYIHDSGYRQFFAPLDRVDGEFVATREYFPRTTRSAIRQRSRWVTGIALQGWERRGWRGSWRTRYWFWRDRKGLLANPLSLLTNLLFAAGVCDLAWAIIRHVPWLFAVNNPKITVLCASTLGLQWLRLAVRMYCVKKIFGFVFSLGVPVRSFHANLINCFASMEAVWRYAKAKRAKSKLVWQKTEHHYPGQETLGLTQDLEQVLLRSELISAQELQAAKSAVPKGTALSDYLLVSGLFSDADLCRVLSMHSGMPATHFDTRKLKKNIMRCLPAYVEKRFGVLPVEMKEGRLVLAGHNVPAPEVLEEIRRFVFLPVDFHLVTHRNYGELRQMFSA